MDCGADRHFDRGGGAASLASIEAGARPRRSDKRGPAMLRLLILIASHAAMLGAGFALGVYFLPS